MISPVFLYGFNVRKIVVKDPLEIKGIQLNTYYFFANKKNL
jgi:hypothetical protein